MKELKIFYDSTQKIGKKSVTEWLEETCIRCQVGGFTIMATIEGKGRHAFHSSRNLLSSFQTPRVMIVVEKRAIVDAFLEAISESTFHGFVVSSEVEGRWINPR